MHKTMEEQIYEKIQVGDNIMNSFIGNPETNQTQVSEQLRRVIQMYASSLDDEKAMEVATVFDPWESGKSYTAGEFITYGANAVGDPQLYKVVQAHTSQNDWTPDVSASLFSAIGLDDSGYPVWSQPSGAHDAYNIGDIVNYNGVLYKSLIDGNTYSPDTYPAGWEEVIDDGN